MLGIRAILQKSLWRTRSIHAGERSEFINDETRSLLFFHASGPRSWNYGYQEMRGLLGTGMPYVFAYEWRDDSASACRLFPVGSDPGCFSVGDQLKQTLVRSYLLLCEGQTRLSTSNLHIGVGRLGDDETRVPRRSASAT